MSCQSGAAPGDQSHSHDSYTSNRAFEGWNSKELTEMLCCMFYETPLYMLVTSLPIIC